MRPKVSVARTRSGKATSPGGRIDRGQDRACSDSLPNPPPAPIPPRRLGLRTSKSGGQVAYPTAPRHASTRLAISGTWLRTSLASPSPSGPEAANPGSPPLPRSSRGPLTAPWFVCRDSISEHRSGLSLHFPRSRGHLQFVPSPQAASMSHAVRISLRIDSACCGVAPPIDNAH